MINKQNTRFIVTFCVLLLGWFLLQSNIGSSQSITQEDPEQTVSIEDSTQKEQLQESSDLQTTTEDSIEDVTVEDFDEEFSQEEADSTIAQEDSVITPEEADSTIILEGDSDVETQEQTEDITVPVEEEQIEPKDESKQEWSSSSVNYDTGLNLLPDDVRNRWKSLIEDSGNEEYSEFFQEGKFIVSRLGDLAVVFDGKAPEKDDPYFGLYLSLRNQLLLLIDKITLKVAFNYTDVDIESLLEGYIIERDSIQKYINSSRKELLETGQFLLRQHKRDDYFIRFPERREAISAMHYFITELMYEETRDRFLKETDIFIEQLNTLSESDPAAAAKLIPPQPNYTRVMAMFQKIIDEFPTSEYADDALYNLGFLMAEGLSNAQIANANRIFETLLSVYTNSKYTLNVLRRVGEYYFMPPVNNLEKAIDIYTRIKDEFANSIYYQEALYKLGWTYYRDSNFPLAIEHFAQVLDFEYREEAAGKTKSAALDITEESINYIGICYAVDPFAWEGTGIDNMVLWLDEHPDRMNNYGRELILQLGVIFHDQLGQFTSAIDVYKKFNELFPNDLRSPNVQYNTVEVFQQGEIYDPDRAHTEKIIYYETYNPDSEWWSVNTDPEIRKTIIPTLEKYLDMIIDETLVLAVDQNSTEEFHKFEHYSRQYLRFWPNGPNVYKIHFNLAGVIENNLHQPMGAMREFWQVATVYEDTTHREISAGRVVAIAQNFVKKEEAGDIYISPTGELLPPHMKAAIEDSIKAVEMLADEVIDVETEEEIVEAVTTDEEITDSLTIVESDTLTAMEIIEPEDEVFESVTAATEDESKEVQITPLLNSERLLLSGFDLFVGFFPESALSPKMLYQAGDILFKHNMFPESRNYFEELIYAYSDNELIENAYRLSLEGHFISREYAEVEELYKRIAIADVSDELKEDSKRRKAESLFLNAKNLKESDNHIAAAEEFKRVALETPDYEYADQSLFRAGLEYRQANAWDKSKDAFLFLVDNYPASKYADQALNNIGLDLQNEVEDFAGSAVIFERLVESYPRSEFCQGALANASFNYAKVEDHESTIRINELYIKMFPKADDADVYLFENADHYLKLDNIEKANEIYNRFATKYPDDPRTIQAYFERGSYFLRQGEEIQAKREFRRAVDSHERLVNKGESGNPRSASQALAQIIAWEHNEYDQLKFNLPESNLTRSKERKKQWRNSLYEKYTKLLNLGRKEGYIALYQMGYLDEELALTTYFQEMPSFSRSDQRQEAISNIVDESILLSAVSVQTYRSGLENLQSIFTQLKLQQDSLHTDYNAFSELIDQMQKEEAEGVSDSTNKLIEIGRIVSEIDSAVSMAENWIEACKNRIPGVTSRNGEYLKRLWNEQLIIRSDERDEEIRLLFREEIINSALTPVASEICGLNFQALNVVKEFERIEEFQPRIEEGYNSTIDTLLAQYIEQCDIAKDRIDRYIAQYSEMLPRGEDAESPDGFYPDEMGMLIQDQLDYLDAFDTDLLMAFSTIQDTASNYELPVGFGEEVNDKALQFVLDQHEIYQQYIRMATDLKEEYTAKYEETDEIQYDDAMITYEDLAAYCTDYDHALLEEGLRIKQDYNVPGIAGIMIMRTLFELNPDVYADMFNIASEQSAFVSSDDWIVWPQFEPGFEELDFDDDEWEIVTLADVPFGTDLGILDSLNAKAIWYWRERPVMEVTEEDILSADSTQISAVDKLEETVEIVEEIIPDTAYIMQIDTILTIDRIDTTFIVDWIDTVFVIDQIDTTYITQIDTTYITQIDTTYITQLDTTFIIGQIDTVYITWIDTTYIAQLETGISDEGVDEDEFASGDEEDILESFEADTTEESDSFLDLMGEEMEFVAVTEQQQAFTIADSIWRFWIVPDTQGVRKYWFRKEFNLDIEPTSSRIWITADDNFSLFINGVYITSDNQDTIDWTDVKDFNVVEYIKVGQNVIAIETSDVDSTGHGLIVGLIFESIPDIERQLDIIVKKEMNRQHSVLQEALSPVEAEKNHRMRTVEKNKLR